MDSDGADPLVRDAENGTLMSHRPRSRVLSRFRGLASDERGASNALLILGAITVFGLVSVSFAGGLLTAMTTMQQQKVNTALAGQVASIAMKEANRGYPVVSALPQSTDITITVGNAEVPAQRIVTVNAAEQTAQVQVRAGRYIHGGFANPRGCAKTATNCVSASEVAISSLSQTVPDTEGISLINQAGNVPASTEVNWKDVAVGGSTVIAIDSAGSLWAWGKNASGEAGVGSTKPVITPTKLTSAGSTIFSQVAAGSNSSYAIDSAGKLWSWGSDAAGQLGNGTPTAAVTKPTKISAENTFRDVDASSDTACAVTTAGGILCWGAKATSTSAVSPTPVWAYGDTADSHGTEFTHVSVGADHKVALDSSGDIFTWGGNNGGELGPRDRIAPKNVPARVKSDMFSASFVDVSAGGQNTFAVDAYGRLFGWGLNANGVLGDGTITKRTDPVRIASNILFRTATLSAENAYGVSREGVAYAWGKGASGGVGNGADADRREPTQITGDAAFIEVATAPNPGGEAVTTWALDTTHRLWAWGTSSTGTWGDGSDAATTRTSAQQNRIRSGGGVTVNQVAAGANHTVALGSDGTIWSWGLGTSGQIGNGGTTNAGSSAQATGTYTDQPAGVSVGNGFILSTGKLGRLVGSGTSANGELGAGNRTSRNAPNPSGTEQYSATAAGESHALAIVRSSGKVVAWGKNANGQVGDQTTTNAAAPVAVVGLPDTRFVQVAAGPAFSAALDVDGNVWAWGDGSQGQLGQGTTDSSVSAVRVLLDAKIVRIAAGGGHMLAVDTAGSTWAWGANTDGQLGTGSTNDKLVVPVKINTPAPLVEIAANASASFGLTAEGKLISWGGKTPADSGHGNTSAKSPTAVASVGGSSFRALAAAADQAFAIDVDGNLWGWGTNTDGELGRGTVSTPTKLTGDTKVLAVATSATNSAFTTADGKLFASGQGANGQLGRSSTAAAAAFTEVAAWNAAAQANTPAYAKNAGAWQTASFTRVAAGGNTSAALDREGHLWMWGAGSTGQLGTGGSENKTTPQLVASSADFVDVAVGSGHVIPLAEDGSVWTFGASSSGANGRSTNLLVPTRAPLAAPIARVDASGDHTVALVRGGGEVFAWGQNASGQLGTAPGAAQTLPVSKRFDGATDVAAGDGYTLVLDGSSKVGVYGAAPWGASANPFTGQYADLEASGGVVVGALRTGTNSAQVYGIAAAGGSAKTLSTVSTSMFTNIAAGSSHLVALDVNGSVWTWGGNGNGQLGRTGTAATASLVPVVGDPARKVFTPQGAPSVTTTTWKVATIDADAKGTVQVNVDAGMPLLSVVVLCDDGSRKQMAKPIASSGDFSFANLPVEGLAGCGTPTIAAILNGAPASVSDVNVIIVPLVYATEGSRGW